MLAALCWGNTERTWVAEIVTLLRHCNCEICRQLWEEYVAATMAEISLRGKEEIAHLQHDDESAAAIERKAAAAGVSRQAARNALKRQREIHRAAENPNIFESDRE